VFDRSEGTSKLVVLDARDVGAGPIARISIPQRVPYGFHATWVPAQEA
jgi:carotenoid cleavage dioxygenase